MEKKFITLLEFMTYLRYPNCEVVIMNCQGETIKTFDPIDYNEFKVYQDCKVSTIKSKLERTRDNHFGSNELLVSFKSSVVVYIWEQEVMNNGKEN